MALSGYCNACKVKRQIREEKISRFEGRTIVRGYCFVCNGKIFKVVLDQAAAFRIS